MSPIIQYIVCSHSTLLHFVVVQKYYPGIRKMDSQVEINFITVERRCRFEKKSLGLNMDKSIKTNVSLYMFC